MSPSVSILIPVYNAEKWLPETLQCAVDQTWSNKKIIVVDDGSTDDSLAVAKQFEGQEVSVFTQKNRGGCAARNRALREAEGDYIQYLDADDLMDADKIEAQVQRLSQEPEGTVAAAKWERFYDGSGKADLETINFREKPYYGDRSEGIEWALDAAAHRGMMPPHSWLVPRVVVEKVGPWNESLLINQDGEYFNRVALASSGIAFCSEARVYYRSGMEGSVSNQETTEALASKYDSIEYIVDQLLEKEDSPRTRQAGATAFFHFAHGAYPRVPDLVNLAINRVNKLGEVPDYEPSGGHLYKMLYDILGWRWAKRIRYWYYKTRYGQPG